MTIVELKRPLGNSKYIVARPVNPLTGKRSPKYFTSKQKAQEWITWARGKSRE